MTGLVTFVVLGVAALLLVVRELRRIADALTELRQRLPSPTAPSSNPFP